jgi:hypothetical protein
MESKMIQKVDSGQNESNKEADSRVLNQKRAAQLRAALAI